MNVEVESATVRTEGCTPQRAERVSRLIFDHLQRRLKRQCPLPGTPRVVPHLQVPSLEVSWAEMTDEAIARTGAAAIARSLGFAG